MLTHHIALVTDENYFIGCLFVVDDRPRPQNLTKTQMNLLGVMAKNVVYHLEMRRRFEERKRISIMSKGLAAFTEGGQRIPDNWKTEKDAETGTDKAHESNIDVREHSRHVVRSPENLTAPIGTMYQDSPLQHSAVKSPVSGFRREGQGHEDVLARGSNLLRESLNVDYTVFFDVKTTALQRHQGISIPN